VPPNALPDRWLSDTTQVVGGATLQLGPEPIIGKQAVLLAASGTPERTLRVATDGLRPFAVTAGDAQ
jgi:general secretion pathway protein H